MTDLRALVTCRHVWNDEEKVRAQLTDQGVAIDIPRFDGQQMEEGDLLPILNQYDGLLAGDDHLTRAVLQSAPRLTVISKWGVGVDGIDRRAADELGIKVFNTPGVFGEELADYAMGYIHLLARRQHEVNARVKSGEWHQVRGVSLADKTIGIVGLGSSGTALARRAAAASMTVLAFEIADGRELVGCEMVDLDTLLHRSDIVSLHLPATPETHHLIEERTLAKMKPGSWLINISRGSLIDEVALVAALRSGHLGGAALDVFEQEPVAPQNPLLAFDNVIVGAHNGSNTDQAVARTTELAVENLLKGLGRVL